MFWASLSPPFVNESATYAGAFIAHWLSRLLYYRLPGWVFTLTYTLFGGLVLVAWIVLPPRTRQAHPRRDR